jgi:chromosome segregation ATPase
VSSNSDKKVPESYEKFLQAADELLLEGQRPTAQMLKKRVNGSLTTCNAALQIWWQTLASRLTYHQQYPDLDHEVVDLAAQLVEEARGKARAWWADKEADLTTKLSEATARSDQLEKESVTIKSEVESVKAELQRKEEDFKRENTALSEVVNERDGQLERLESAFRAMEKQLGDIKADLALEQKSRLKAESRCEDLLRTNQDQSEVLAGVREERTSLVAEVDARKREIQRLTTELEKVSEQKAKAEAISADLRNELIETAGDLKLVKSEADSLRSWIADRDKELTTLKGAIQSGKEEMAELASGYKERIVELQSRITEQSNTIERLSKLQKEEIEEKPE